ncbi:[Fe-S]-dependent transcriptional repressor FeoC [Escherichia coli]|nr:[Fe-S]-dependent transcriptional repressor FeoC [Escherichia coli]EKX3778421.1 [Fe-S]-dependent transcriptional repressor FeoC [Escherichia coli]HAG8585400.1 [Fe-S]-dependent transcriptional repressor FeoC [Escherichia coli]HAG8610623.1 [Fe-S]-dependent transcriptional repressor FeoC [Escherichia coli]HAG9114618.1 [Fe-S]-dependent transcriptional repressor FeoC [Escherichia coli]
MASLIQVRDLLALRGRMEAAQISQTLNTPQPMINAMLQQLESMGKAVRIQEEPDGCLSGNCKSGPEGKACLREWWALR